MSKTIHIATWNLHFGIDLPDILSAVKENTVFSDLDFLMLQEASMHFGKEDAHIIAGVLGKHYTYYQVTAQTQKGIPQANAIIWNTERVSADSFEALEMPPFHPGAILHKPYKKIFAKEHRLAVLFKTVFQKRISLVIETNLFGYTARIYVVHFDVLGLASKKTQMAFLFEDSKKRKNVDIEIIAGDINTFKYFKLPYWYGIKKIITNAGFQDITTDIPWTYLDKRFPKRFPSKHKVDAIFIRSQNAFTHSSWTLNVTASDHLPVFTDIIFHTT